jgi:hypothetical protein
MVVLENAFQVFLRNSYFGEVRVLPTVGLNDPEVTVQA